ncbi:MAG: glycosyl hydrolase [Phycisphaerae bacterium]
MTKRYGLFAILAASLMAAPFSFADDEADTESDKMQDKVNASLLGAFKLRSIGPAFMSGRISDIAVDPLEPNTWYVAAGSGNLWKTTNAGTTWKPIFDHYGSYSIGCITIDPNNHNTIWVGSGEDVGGRHVGFGDGVYKSTDGGRSFRNLGLKASEHIAKIVVDPRDSNVVYVAAQGPLWSGGGERGLYKTTNGGETWVNILSAGKYTGVTDIVLDPRNPDTLYAAKHQRLRTVAALLNGGPESGIFKSTDAGKTWRELRGGLPGGDRGKIALAISPQQPDVMYATIELPGRKGGFWRSTNAGESWNKMSDYVSGGTGPHYYQELWPDPHHFDTLYQANVQLGKTVDGGKNWFAAESDEKHVDNHAVAFHPSDPDFLLVGCDGGLYLSRDAGESYQFFANLPITQFYKVAIDNDYPFYNMIGGTQDNNTQYGPSQTQSRSGIANSDWKVIFGGDGHDCAIDPEDPDTLYGESQQGFLRRFDRKTGASIDIRPQPDADEETLRFNWDSPINISPHSHTRLYFASQKLHRSDDRGDSWKTISPDLTRGMDRFKMKMMDRVWSIDATWDLYAMSQFGTITSVSESPVQEGLIYVGTDDGLIQITEDGGETWRKVERIYGVPEFAFVNDIKADRHDANTAYVCMDNHKEGDYKPYLLKTTDRGATWKPMTGDLPDRHLVWRIVQDDVKPEFFFLGTEFGLFTSFDAGEHWMKLKGGMPTIPVRDLEIHEREDDVVCATFGRSFYILDDYTPLRELTDDLLKNNDFYIFPIKKALLFNTLPLGGRSGSAGDAYYMADNPPAGAIFTYFLKESLETKQQQRKKKEAKNKKSGADNPYPGFDVLKEEQREENPLILFTITDADGKLIARESGPTSAGIHRINWNLREDGGGGRFGGLTVLPGTYTVTATKFYEGQRTPLGEPRTFEVVALEGSLGDEATQKAVAEFHDEVSDLLRAIGGATGRLDEVREDVSSAKRAVGETPTANLELRDALRAFELKLEDMREKLSGDELLGENSVPTPPSVRARVFNAFSGTRNSPYGPTKTQRRQYEIARDQYVAIEESLRGLLENEYPALLKQLDEAEVPWTPGRPIPTLKK